ncbi:MAG: hypothetical protein IPG22_06250 [Acidobacteria bacterium]|nr:hypothetical protein [Acidobacteriota bacterium]
MANRFFVDFKESAKGEIVGGIKFPRDSVFVLESLAEIVTQFSEVCCVPPEEIIVDVLAVLRNSNATVLQ